MHDLDVNLQIMHFKLVRLQITRVATYQVSKKAKIENQDGLTLVSNYGVFLSIPFAIN